MITWLVGDNSYEVRQELIAIEASFSGVSERFDGTELTMNQLPDVLMGVSLFSSERLVVITDITLNSVLWERLPDWLGRVSDDIHLVLIDTKPDKRKAAYKALKQAAVMREFPAWTERDTQRAEQWVTERAKALGLSIDGPVVRHLVNRVGLDQWRLSSALDSLALLEVVTIETLNDIVPSNLQENIFQLFETALEGESQKVAAMLKTLMLQEDPYALFALLNSQVLTLAAVTFSGSEANPSKDFAIHPFVASKLARHSTRLGKQKVGGIVERFAKTDAEMKRSRAEPWLLMERTLLEVAR